MKKIIPFVLVASVLCFGLPSCKSNKGSKKSSSSKVSKKPSNPKGVEAVKAAKSYMGTRYKFGGTTKKGIDCSGLTSQAYKQAGVTLPRTSSEQSRYGTRVYVGELEVGDLVFFGAKPKSKKITHVGIISQVSSDRKVIKFIHASSSRGVVESEFTSDYYRSRYIKAIRP